MTVLLSGFTSTPNSPAYSPRILFKVLPFTASKRADANRIAISFREAPNITVFDHAKFKVSDVTVFHTAVLQLQAPAKRRLLFEALIAIGPLAPSAIR